MGSLEERTVGYADDMILFLRLAYYSPVPFKHLRYFLWPSGKLVEVSNFAS